MDPFMGLGSTAVACAELGIDFVGVEMDRAYLDESVERVRDALAKGRATTPRKQRETAGKKTRPS